MTERPFRHDPMLDRLLDLLVDPRRRRVLASLADRTRPIRLEALARDLAASHRPAAADEEVERIALELHHVHLPKLVGAGLLEYDADRRVVEVARDGARVEPYLELARRISDGL